MFTIRDAAAADGAFLESMLAETVNWLPERSWSRERIMSTPSTAHYVTDWPRPGDAGLIAVDPQRRPIGATWWRVFPADDPGYGYVSSDVPEVTLAVAADHRGRGVGRALLRALHDRARRAGIPMLSPSVERANPAHRLYLAEGYRVTTNGRDSDTMVINLRTAASLNRSATLSRTIIRSVAVRLATRAGQSRTRPGPTARDTPGTLGEHN